MSFHVFTNIGNKRQNNEDSFLKIEPKKGHYILAVADGMGGHNAGEVASSIAIESIKNYSFNFNDNIMKQIEYVINNANKDIFAYSKEDVELKEMGTTLTLTIIKDDTLYFGHVGDSRIYLYDEMLKQITTDHSLVNDLVKNKSIDPNEAFNHPQKNIITQALGIDKELEIQSDKLDIKSNNIVMLCTDGLTDMIRFKNIEKVFQNYDNVKNMIEALGEEALQNGGQDNITIIMGRI
ncbi:MAG: Stp1/IreP family PP2C-type Ser/Thr phosphatase [Halanaerobiales bacterium]|nr:Stp1/IreP family PP2C-type Ser/Thr phosphatase [Halanaerobiales bacterium]